MTLYVQICDNCQKEAELHALVDEMERFKERVEATQSTDLFDQFPIPYLVKKKLGGRQGRLIATLRPVAEHAVVVFLSIMIRGHREYGEFVRDPVLYGRNHFDDVISDAMITAYVEERARVAPPPRKMDPSEVEYSLLYDAFSHRSESNSDVLVCETAHWVDAVGTDRISKQLAMLARPCLSALEKPEGLHFTAAEGKSGWGVWALRRADRLLLIAPVTESTAEQAEQLARDKERELEQADATALLRASRRAYPSLVLADDELWIDLEREPIANIALSPEESEVLESARQSSNPFPLFINGRAGSGKSTILQYLFADLLFNYLSKPEARGVSPPIYLTASSELLRLARNFVERLLRSEAAFARQALVKGENVTNAILDESFKEFYAYVLSLIPLSTRTAKFARSNRVDYSRFRALWNERFGKDRTAIKDFGPDLSWHVIRSYIKGMSAETYLDPEDYALLPENQLSVTQESYQLVFNRVWTGWYHGFLESDRLWDDQDLTRYVLDNDLAKPVYPAVFCDEAQDFTRLELELLLRINLFSARTLPAADVGRVCFAFAGDQFQTLNPTGFRWDAIKATFVEKFIFALDPSRRLGRTDLNYRELQYNYRSSDRIVRFANHMQALRAALFDLPDLRPQMPWTTDRMSFPVNWFRATDAAFWDKFRELSSVVVIVPCAEGEEAAYVRADSHLSEYIRIEDGVPVNVLSASRAKGCEYVAVVVYGFGEAAGVNVLEELTRPRDEKSEDAGKTLPLQYFINRLYVAVSRPKRRLVIVDTDRGFERLWKCTQEEVAETLMLTSLKKGREIWGDSIEGMTMGSAEDLVRDIAADPLDNAKSFESEGRARSDSFLLKQAAQAYRSAGDMPKVRECRARALEADGHFLEAGNAFLEAGFVVPEGVRCLWLAGAEGWKQLANAYVRHPAAEQESEFQCARLLQEKPDVSKTIEFIRRIAARLEDPVFAESCASSPAWRDALAELIRKLSGQSGVSIESWRQLAILLEKLRQSGMSPPASDAAAVNFASGRFVDAVRLWDEAGNTRDPNYARAKAFAEPYPERVVPLASLKLWREIESDYMAHPGTELRPEQAVCVANALRESHRLKDSFQVAWAARVADPLLRLCLETHANDPSLAVQALHGALVCMVDRKNWDLLAPLIVGTPFRPTTEWTEPSIISWITKEADQVRATLVRAFGRSGDLSDAPEHQRKSWEKFLRDYLRVKDGRWHNNVSVEEAGAALERAGRFTDAIAFYEAVRRLSGVAADKLFARRRWLVCKDRQLRHEQSQGESGRTRQIEREINLEKASLQIDSIVSLGEYPDLKPIEIAGVNATKSATAMSESAGSGKPGDEAAADRLQINVAAFEFTVARSNKRVNITNGETMETAYVKLASRECGGEVAFTNTGDSLWVCDQWNLSVKFPRDGESTIKFGILGSGVELGVLL
jgi:hypothetical protein